MSNFKKQQNELAPQQQEAAIESGRQQEVQRDQDYTETEYEIYDYVMETTDISTEQAKKNMAKKHDLTLDEVTAIMDKVMTAIYFPKDNYNPKAEIQLAVKDFAKIRNAIIRRDFALIEYEHTFEVWDRADVHRRTKQYMDEVLDVVIQHTDSEKIRLAPYHPDDRGGFIAVALLQIERDEYKNGKDVEQYANFIWKN